MKVFKKLLTGLTVFVSLITPAFAWEPTQPIIATVGYGPGSGNEILFRKITEIITKTHPNLRFVVENKPGADETIAMTTFANKDNNNHILYVPAVGAFVSSPVWHQSVLKVDPMEFEFVSAIGQAPFALVANSSSPVKNMEDFVKYMKSGAPINIGNGGPLQKVVVDYMGQGYKNVQGIPFNGPAAAAAAVVGGQIEFAISPVSFFKQHVDNGTLRFIGVTGGVKAPGAENAQLISNYIPNVSMITQVGVVLPKGTDPAVTAYYRNIFTTAAKSEEYKQFLTNMYWGVHNIDHADYKKWMANQQATWQPYIRSTFKPASK
jgi:tripartite-type tricarboxylate transporter receptor subunit TctC